MASERLESERVLMETDRRSMKPGIDHRDNEAHLAAVRDRASAALHEPRRVAYPPLVAPPRAILDKVGR
jgi:hypothetical protein